MNMGMTGHYSFAENVCFIHYTHQAIQTVCLMRSQSGIIVDQRLQLMIGAH